MKNNVMTVKVAYQSIDSSNSPERGDVLVFNADFFNVENLEKLKQFFQKAQASLGGSGFSAKLTVREELFSVADDFHWRNDESYIVADVNRHSDDDDVFMRQILVGKYDSADFIETEPFGINSLIEWHKKIKHRRLRLI